LFFSGGVLSGDLGEKNQSKAQVFQEKRVSILPRLTQFRIKRACVFKNMGKS